jgi:hypothetical protein
LQDIRVKYAHEEWTQERAAWRSVIQLNLIRSVLTIVDTVQAELDNDRVSLKGSKKDPDAPSAAQSSVQLSETIRTLLLRLGPLRMVETELRLRLGAASEEVREENGHKNTKLYPTPFDRPITHRGGGKEFVVRRWNDILKTVVKPAPSEGRRLPDLAAAQPEGRDQPTEIIASFRGDMKSLWEDEPVRALLGKKKVYLEHTAGLYVDVLVPKYHSLTV